MAKNTRSKKEVELELWQKVGITFLVVVFSGFFGWVYEFFFYYFDGGMKEWYMQGGNLLPWINIYAIGAVLIIGATYTIRKYPWAVFLASIVISGITEFLGGWLVYVIGNGMRYWDYNVEILNFGNIGGFICFRSVLFFGISAMLLVYIMMPLFTRMAQKMSKRAFLALAITLFALVILDEVVNLTLKNMDLPTAVDFYKSYGLKYR